jgi:predicted nucleic acid-binding protein
MIGTIVLDSGPLGLIVHRRGVREADECRAWLVARLQQGVRVVVPEIVDYELRRELLRLGKAGAIADLDAFEGQQPDRYRALSTADLRRAAQLWSDARSQGLPTAHPHELDVDVILAAQALGLGLAVADFVVATSNPAHLSRFVPADDWRRL